MELQHFSHDHSLILHGENDLVPDDWHSYLCKICRLPIFSTPSYICSQGCKFLLHKRCAHFPKKLEHFLHKEHALTFVTEAPPGYKCHTCKNFDGVPKEFFYLCIENEVPCETSLHVFCALPLEIKFLHRSHEHELIPLRGDTCAPCGACGDEHKGWFYLCNMCGYWLHRQCARLPNTILHKEHGHGLHPLSLTYTLQLRSSRSYFCAFCEKKIASLGIYFCARCEYYAHIKCATEDRQLYKSVSSLEIELDPDIVRFPMPEECMSVVPYLLSKMSSRVIKDNRSPSAVKLCKDGHPLFFHDNDDKVDGDEGLLRVCDGCIEPISGPYYVCSHSKCSNFFLHSCCADLPPTFPHPAHEQHPLVLLKRPPYYDLLSRFRCRCCQRECNGYAYGCKDCKFLLDIVCVFLPGSITHEAHGRRHILVLDYKNYTPDETSFECPSTIDYNVRTWFYKCSSCRDFQVHAHCVFLPTTVGHKYDQHPLKLATSFDENYSSDQNFCEICEERMDKDGKKSWYYECGECCQSFHVNCFQSVSLYYSKIKFGGTVSVRCHNCPLTSVRMLTVCSHRCGKCGERIKGLDDDIAFECSKCDFWIHCQCAEECLLTDAEQSPSGV